MRESEQARQDQARSHEQGQAQLLAILSGMAEGVLAVDAKGRVLFLNSRLEALFGIKAQEALGRPQIEVLREASLSQMLAEALEGREAPPRDLAFFRPRERTIQVRTSPLPGPSQGAVAIFLDVSRERKLEALRSEFVANVSHELKTPLTAIRAALETLADGALEDPAVSRNFLGKALRNTDRLTSLIDDILCLSRIEDEQRRGQVEAAGRCHLADALAAALGMVEAKAQARGLRVKLEVAEGLPELAMNAGSLGRVLTNLLDNAVKYSPEGGELRVSAGRGEAGLAVVEVADQGPGIAESDQGRIFERFYRPDKARSRELGGTGLGLSIVKHLVESVGGKVGLRSSLGQGSRFMVSIPAVGGEA